MESDPVYNFLDNLTNPEVYTNFTDKIISRIKKSSDPRLKKSQDIINRIDTRKLYQYVDGFCLDSLEQKDMFVTRDIADLEEGLREEDFILLPTKYDYGCQKNFPIDEMTFYKNDTDLQIIDKVNDFEYGLSKPMRNQEAYMRIFVRNPEKFDLARKAFRKYCMKINAEWTAQMDKQEQARNSHRDQEIDQIYEMGKKRQKMSNSPFNLISTPGLG